MSAAAARVVRVRVPASSANLGPGFDVMAAALSLWLALEVERAAAFELRTELPVPRDRSNLVVRAFERLLPADGLRFTLASEIPMSGGLGSSAAAVVAGLLAARALGGREDDVLGAAAAIEGHPDNAAAALVGGFVVCGDGDPARVPAPVGLEAVLVIPDEAVATSRARAALPAAVPLGDAVFNVARASLLTLGLASGDLALVARGLDDRLHQPHRAHLYPRSAELARGAAGLGALGATISGAGPTVLVWCESARVDGVAQRLRDATDGWARVLPVAFEATGARVEAR